MQSTNFFKSGLKLSPLFPSMLDKSLKLFLSYHFTIFSHPPNPQFNDETPQPRFNDVSPSVFASSLNRGCGDSDALRKKFQTFVHDWIVGWTKVRTIFFGFFMFTKIVKKNVKFEIENLDFGFWILASTLTREAPLAVVLRGDTTTRGATRARSWRKCYLSTVDRDGRQQSTRPPGVSLLTREDTAFPNVLPLEEINIFNSPQSTATVNKTARS